MSGKPDFKKGKRVKNISAIETKMMDSHTCRACDTATIKLEAHHLVNRSQGGDDVEDNIYALCSPCHNAFTHLGGYAADLVAKRIRRTLSRLEIAYIVKKKSRAWMDTKYPWPQDGGLSEAVTEGGGEAETGSGLIAGGRKVVGTVSESPTTSESVSYLDSEDSARLNTASENQEEGSVSGVEPPPGVPPGKECPSCHRKVPHPKKKTSPVSAVFAHRGPLDTKDEYKEILTAALKHGGMAEEQKYFEHEGILRMAAQLLAGPPGTLVMKP